MLKRLDPFVLSEQFEEDGDVATWAWGSHYWIEKRQGYYECKWCKRVCYSNQPIDRDYPLCKENYSIKRLLAGVV